MSKALMLNVMKTFIAVGLCHLYVCLGNVFFFFWTRQNPVNESLRFSWVMNKFCCTVRIRCELNAKCQSVTFTLANFLIVKVPWYSYIDVVVALKIPQKRTRLLLAIREQVKRHSEHKISIKQTNSNGKYTYRMQWETHSNKIFVWSVRLMTMP